jgi:protein-disulfide isomerase
MTSRRNVVFGVGAVAAVAAAGGAYLVLQPNQAGAQGGAALATMLVPAAGNTDHPMGSTENKVVLFEYLSPSCPHCADFALNQFPALKAEYIDTKKITFIPRPFVRNTQDAVVFMLAEAAGPEKYHELIDTFFKTQEKWVVADKPSEAIFAIAQQFGFTREAFDAALKNNQLLEALEASKNQAAKDYKLQGTPTFYLNGVKYEGPYTADGLKAAIDPLLA